MGRYAAGSYHCCTDIDMWCFLWFTLSELNFAECFLSTAWLVILIYCSRIDLHPKEITENEEEENSTQFAQNKEQEIL